MDTVAKVVTNLSNLSLVNSTMKDNNYRKMVKLDRNDIHSPKEKETFIGPPPKIPKFKPKTLVYKGELDLKPTPTPFLIPEVIENIMSYLNETDLKSARLTCKLWNVEANNEFKKRKDRQPITVDLFSSDISFFQELLNLVQKFGPEKLDQLKINMKIRSKHLSKLAFKVPKFDRFITKMTVRFPGDECLNMEWFQSILYTFQILKNLSLEQCPRMLCSLLYLRSCIQLLYFPSFQGFLNLKYLKVQFGPSWYESTHGQRQDGFAQILSLAPIVERLHVKAKFANCESMGVVKAICTANPSQLKYLFLENDNDNQDQEASLAQNSSIAGPASLVFLSSVIILANSNLKFQSVRFEDSTDQKWFRLILSRCYNRRSKVLKEFLSPVFRTKNNLIFDSDQGRQKKIQQVLNNQMDNYFRDTEIEISCVHLLRVILPVLKQ